MKTSKSVLTLRHPKVFKEDLANISVDPQKEPEQRDAVLSRKSSHSERQFMNKSAHSNTRVSTQPLENTLNHGNSRNELQNNSPHAL